MKRPFVLCIDLEPDERRPDRDQVDLWGGSPQTFERFERLREQFAEATGQPARFGWFMRMDPQIEALCGSALWICEQFGKQLETLHAAGDELGVHAHAWRWLEEEGGWVNDIGDPAWVDHCLRLSFAAFEEGFGRPARAFRFGDRWLSDQVVAALEELGVACDLTLEPGKPKEKAEELREPSTGDVPSYKRAPRRPYRPSRDDYLTPGSATARNLWMIPVTSGRVRLRLSRKPPFYYRTSVNALNLVGHPHWLPFILEDKRAAPPEAPIVAVLRTGDLSHPHWRRNFEANIDQLLAHPLIRGVEFQSPAQVARTLGSTS
ncbi:MAG: hypothetical protein ACO1SX_00165 [Actinomycetota bacterium]